MADNNDGIGIGDNIPSGGGFMPVADLAPGDIGLDANNDLRQIPSVDPSDRLFMPLTTDLAGVLTSSFYGPAGSVALGFDANGGPAQDQYPIAIWIRAYPSLPPAWAFAQTIIGGYDTFTQYDSVSPPSHIVLGTASANLAGYEVQPGTVAGQQWRLVNILDGSPGSVIASGVCQFMPGLGVTLAGLPATVTYGTVTITGFSGPSYLRTVEGAGIVYLQLAGTGGVWNP